jgi:hypothetical protein
MSFTDADWALWSKSFVDWSEGLNGFYVDQRWVGPSYNDWQTLNPLEPIRWVEHEQRVLRYLYTVDRKGKLPHHTVYFVDKGKSAKSLKLAALTQWFAMFRGQSAQCFLISNSREQVKDRAYNALRMSLDNNPYLLEGRDYEALEKDIVILKSRNYVVPLPKMAGTVSGGNQILMGIDEWWDWTGSKDEEAQAELKRTPTRRVSHTVVASYPPFKGVRGPMNRLLDAYFDDQDGPREMLKKVDGLEDLPLWVAPNGAVIWWDKQHRHPWHTQEFLNEVRQDPTVSENHINRIWYTMRVAQEDVFIELDRWDLCEDSDLLPARLETGRPSYPCVMGGDLAFKRATSAFTMRTIDPLTGRYRLLDHQIWNPAMYESTNRDRMILDIETWLADRVRLHKVLAVYLDPYGATYLAARLKEMGVNVVEVQQIKERGQADTEYYGYILTRRLRNYPHQRADLRNHVANAVAREMAQGGFRLDQRRTTSPIDGAVADSMCCKAVTDFQQELERLVRRPWRGEIYTYKGYEGRIQEQLGYGR